MNLDVLSVLHHVVEHLFLSQFFVNIHSQYNSSQFFFWEHEISRVVSKLLYLHLVFSVSYSAKLVLVGVLVIVIKEVDLKSSPCI